MRRRNWLWSSEARDTGVVQEHEPLLLVACQRIADVAELRLHTVLRVSSAPQLQPRQDHSRFVRLFVNSSTASSAGAAMLTAFVGTDGNEVIVTKEPTAAANGPTTACKLLPLDATYDSAENHYWRGGGGAFMFFMLVNPSLAMPVCV